MVSYTSADTKYFTVNQNGVIKGVKETGDAGVALTVTTVTGLTATVPVVVLPAPTSVQLSYTTYTLGLGEKIGFNASPMVGTKLTKATMTWSSSDSKVVAIVKTDDTGRVYLVGKKKGTATITVKTHNGKKATCKVTVK